MRENRVKAALKAGKTVVGMGIGLVMVPNVVRVLAQSGLDFIWLDCEHNLIAPDSLVTVVQMARACGISPIVRPADTEYHLIANTLDSGAEGIIVPRVETKEQAERLVSYAKFPPMGIRGCGTLATLDYKREDWQEALPWLNDQSLIISQVESVKAIDHLEDVVQVPGIDVILVGPTDLSISLGVAGRFNDPKMLAAVDKVIAICTKHKKPCGIVVHTADAVQPWWEKGMRFFSCTNDTGLLLAGATAAAKTVRAYAGAAG
jgi:2-keto-3-deoxy-L-rhamnonate aldolase RhmA